jgi:transposase
MIPKDFEARIQRLFHVERWSKGAIGRELGVHHSVVSRVLQEEGGDSSRSRPSKIDPYVSFIEETIRRYPKITASRIYGMVVERGYRGGPSHFRSVIRTIRSRVRAPEAFLRLRVLPGEESQVDWGHFGKIRIGSAERHLMAFVMVLSYSRRIFLRFFPGQTTAHFLRGHVAAFRAFGGVTRTVLYDNLKSAVLDRRGDAIRFNPDLIALSAHYRFEARPVAPYRGNEKGRVERAIRYVRDAFFAGLEWNTLAELNARADAFGADVSLRRPWPEDRTRSVADAFAEEQSHLLPLRENPFPAFERVEVSVGKTPYVRFDTNDYSVPSRCVRRTLVVVATMETVRVLDGMTRVAQHRRSFDRGKTIEDPRHIEELQAQKRHARKGRFLDLLQRAVPDSETLLKRMAERGRNVGAATFAIHKLLEIYGRSELAFGIQEALARGVFHPHAVRHAIEKRREERGREAALPIHLPDDPRVRDITITPHELSRYDEEISQ